MNSSQKSSQRIRADDMTEEQIKSAALNVTAFLLCDMRNKRKIRKEDIVTNVLNKSSKQFAAIMKIVKHNLFDVFGFHIAYLPKSEDTFIIINKHSSDFIKLNIDKPTDYELQADLILTVVLGSIFMNRGQMFESHVIAILDTIGFLKKNFFGLSGGERLMDNVTKLVTNQFVKQMYLESLAIERPDQAQNPPLPDSGKKTVNVLKWGFRALVEVDVDKVVDYLTKIHDGKKPASFPSSYYREFKAKQTQIRTELNL